MTTATIVNVNDSEAARYLSSRTLRSAGYDVLEASSGQEALELVEQKLPKLVLLDVKLPDISGYDVCRRIKSNPLTSSIMVLQTSATYLDTSHLIQGLESGADNYLTEPVPPRVLVATVRALLRVRQMEEERDELLARERAARAEAEAANRAKDDFLATLSHELRTPVGSVLAWTHLLRTGNLDPQQTARALDSIERSARTQAQLIDDLLDVSRIIAGKLLVETRPLSLATALRAAVEAVTPAAQAKGIRVELRLDDTVSVKGDGARLQQVFGNLLSNAVKFTPAGGRVSVVLAAMGTQAVITVSDTGKGINPEFLPFVFERFRQGDTSTTRSEGGLGLGLAIAHRIVELHGGSIRADSRGPDCGASFTISLPLLAGSSRGPGA